MTDLWLDRYYLGVVKLMVGTTEHRQVHVWPERDGSSLCGRYNWHRDAWDKDVSTGYPDCNGCVNEAFRRMVAA